MYSDDTTTATLTEETRSAEDPRIETVLAGVDPRPLARPGQSAKLKIYPDPETGETVRGYRRHAHSVMYTGTNGIREYMPPPPNTPELDVALYERQFDQLAKTENLRLLTRQERREMWKAEQKRVKERKKRQKAEVARILTDAGADR